ncbi:MAG TPA: winged helix-turn-helix domain-containing protein [Streptosporangiaceae bacterium]|nr:winged helix-turn-helix domain-containing protein [Streptosporangiaceae bacterium]
MSAGEEHQDPARLPLVVAALDHPQRLKVIAALRHGRQYVSALARELRISRPLLYLHLDRLEKAGLVTGSLELGGDGKAVKWYELEPFDIRLTPDVVAEAAAALPAGATPGEVSRQRTRPVLPGPEDENGGTDG